MRHIRIPFLVVALSLTLTGMAFAINMPEITTWSGSLVNYTGTGVVAPALVPGLTITGVGGGGPGLGDVLLAPLYDVRNVTDPNLPGTAGTTTQAQYTMFSIVNTDSAYGVVARLRFREWKRSRECFDIDIPLTTNDVWVGEVSRVSTGGASLYSPDRWVNASPSPDIINSPFPTSTFPAEGLAFRPYALEAPQDVTRCEYGYFEIIGEERVGVPNSAWLFPRVALTERDVKNVLMGNVIIIRPATKITHQYNMTAIANFAVDIAGIWDSPSTAFPNLLTDVQGELTNPGAGGFNNLEALLSKRTVYYQYAAQGVLGGYDAADTTQTPMGTSLVITFPTKHFHYAKSSPFPILGATYPYGPPFTGAFETLGDSAVNYGEVIGSRIWNRSENELYLPGDAISPQLTPGIPRLPYEVNVIGFYPTDPATTAPIFRNNVSFATASLVSNQKFYAGWGRIDLSPPFYGNDTRTYRQGETGIIFNFYNNFFSTYYGLPAMGIVMTEFYNGSNSGYYGNTVPWQYAVDWSNPAVP